MEVLSEIEENDKEECDDVKEETTDGEEEDISDEEEGQKDWESKYKELKMEIKCIKQEKKKMKQDAEDVKANNDKLVTELEERVRCPVTPLHRVVNPKVTFAQRTQQILSFVTKIRSPIGFFKSFTVGKYPYQHAKTVISTLCNVKCKIKHFKFRL